MADIFISYSRKDSEQATVLAERLRASGADVWMDSAALTAAETWSAEIVAAINTCRLFIILLSPSSVTSRNVNKEVALASEKTKTILPIVLEPCKLTDAMEYALAGLQHVQITDEAGLERAFAKYGITGIGFSKHQPTNHTSTKRALNSKKPSALRALLVTVLILGLSAGGYMLLKKKDAPPKARRSYFLDHRVAILPLESIRQTPEDQQIADAITAEVINVASPLMGITVTDRKTVMSYQGKKADLKSVAKDLNVGYILDGTMQRQGPSIVVSAQLTDVARGKIIFSGDFEGSAGDLLQLRRRMAQAIGYELQYAIEHLPDSLLNREYPARIYAATKLHDEGHKYLDGNRDQWGGTSDLDSLGKALSLFEQASRTDSLYIAPLNDRALCLINRYSVTHVKHDLDEADSLLKCSRDLDPASPQLNQVFVKSIEMQADSGAAERQLQDMLRLDPDNPWSYTDLATFYAKHKRHDLAIPPMKELTTRQLTNIGNWFGLLIEYRDIGDSANITRCLKDFGPVFERFLLREERDYGIRLLYGVFLAIAGERAEATKQLNFGLPYEANFGISDCINAALICHSLRRQHEVIELLVRLEGLLGQEVDWKNYYLPNTTQPDRDFVDMAKQPGFEAELKQERGKRRTP